MNWEVEQIRISIFYSVLLFFYIGCLKLDLVCKVEGMVCCLIRSIDLYMLVKMEFEVTLYIVC